MDEIFFEDVFGFVLIFYMGYGNGNFWWGGKVVLDFFMFLKYIIGLDFVLVDFKSSYFEELKR